MQPGGPSPFYSLGSQTPSQGAWWELWGQREGTLGQKGLREQKSPCREDKIPEVLRGPTNQP